MSFSLQPLTPTIGAIVNGLDLSRPVEGEGLVFLKAALLERQVLYFENQAITPHSQRALAASYGELHVHPIYPSYPDIPEIMVLDTSGANTPDNDVWHSDVTFIENPPAIAILSAQALPPAGGDTLWATATAAYEALSEPLKVFLGELKAEHDIVKAFPPSRWETGETTTRWREAREKHPPIIHPVIRTHPETGKKAIFVNDNFTTRIVDLHQRESDALLSYLIAHISRPEFVVRWRWKAGDVAIWDNRVTQHYAIADYLPNRRLMHRATVLGDRPF